MCLYCDGIRRTADRDIRVWKRVCLAESGEGWCGVFKYNDKVFPFDEVCEESGVYEGCGVVRGGFFHSCIYEIDAIRMYAPSGSMPTANEAVAECVIPEGASYYIGFHDDIASDRIIVKKPEKML